MNCNFLIFFVLFCFVGGFFNKLYIRMTCWVVRLARGLLQLLSVCWRVSASSLEFQMQGGKCFLQMSALDWKLCSEVFLLF